MDLKSMLFGGALALLGVAAGGGIYGMYVKQATKLALGETNLVSLMQECALLETTSSPNQNDIKSVISKIDQQSPNAVGSFAIVAVISGEGNTIKPINDALSQCSQQLKLKVR